MKVHALLVKRVDVFENIVTAPGADRTLRGERETAYRAIAVGVLLQNSKGG